MPESQKIIVSVLRDSCPDEETCPAVTRVDGDRDGRYLIGEQVTDPEILAAHSDRMGVGEILVRFPSSLIPEVDLR